MVKSMRRTSSLEDKVLVGTDGAPAARGTITPRRTFDITGQLELLGKSQPLTLQATWNKSAESPLGGFGRKPYVMGVSARGSFKRSAYGMNYAVANGWVGDEVALIIEFEAVRQ